ncbi:MAG: PLP-dependent aminotransferase family protein [Christensenellales bacterium]
MTVSPSQVIIGAGTEYLYSRLIQLFGRKSTFGFEESSFDKLSTICTVYGNPYNFIPIDESGLIVDELKKSATDIVHVSPSNHFPTGIVMPIKRRLELMEWAYESDNRYIIEDDYDSEFRYKGKYIAPIYTEDVNNKVIYMNTFSKTMVPSLRISYMVLPVDILERYKETMSFYSCTVSSFEQYALARFISGGYFERHINRIKNYYKKLRVQIINAIRESSIGEISEIVEHHSGTHFLLKVKTDLSEEEINEKCLENDLHILTYADYIKDDTDSDKSMTLVINYAGINPERIDDVIKRIERVFE